MQISLETLRNTKGIGNKTLERIIEQHEINNNIKSYKSQYIPSEEYKINGDVNLWQGDCLKLMEHIPDKSIDMILCDLPYGTTWCSWDEVISPYKLWGHYNRIIKDNGAIVLFSSQPFTTQIISSNFKNFKYTWYWVKNIKGNYLNAKRQPLRQLEEICVFNKHNYYPQGLEPLNTISRQGGGARITLRNYSMEWYQENTGYPSNVLYYTLDKDKLHPTQKPVKLLEYLIKTYTDENMIVLDNCMGSGSTGVACKNLNRRFIGIELDKEYFDIAEERING